MQYELNNGKPLICPFCGEDDFLKSDKRNDELARYDCQCCGSVHSFNDALYPR